MNKTFYRKYRPKTFSEVIGQDFIKKTLMNSIVLNKLSHAYIFSGPRGTGKTSISKIFAKAINCLNNSDGDCCNKCENCVSINENNTFDVIEIDAASNNGVSEVRNLIDSTTFLPNRLRKKVYIIDESHMLTNSAWNALLKTIEDPPSHVIFIFATTEPSKIISTITSRCERYNFSKINSNYIEEMVKNVCKKESIECDDESLRLISVLSEGSVRDALSILSQLSSYSNKITEESINNIFGLVNIRKKIDLIKYITSKNINGCLKMIDEFYDRGCDFYKLTYQLIQIILDMYIFKKTKSLDNLSILSETTINSFNISTNESLKMIEILEKCLSDIKFNGNEKFYFELAIINCVSLFDFNISNHYINENKDIENRTIEDEIVEEVTLKKVKNLDDILLEKNIGVKEETNIEDNSYMNNVRFEDIITNRNISQDKNSLNAQIKKDNEFSLKNDVDTTKQNNLDQFDTIECQDEDIKENSNLEKKDIIFEKNEKKISKIDDIKILNFDKMFKIQEVVPGDKPRVKINDKKIENHSKKNVKPLPSDFSNLFTNFSNKNKSEIIQNIDNMSHEIKKPNTNVVEIKNTIKEDIDTKKKNTSNIDVKRPESNDEHLSKINNEKNKIESIFYSIVENNDNTIKERLNSIFDTIKGNIPKVPEEGYIIDANKILISSKNGFVFLFDNSLSSQNLNVVCEDKDFIEYIKNKFNNVYYVIGVSKDEAKKLGENYKKLKSNGESFADVDKSTLVSKIEKKTSAKDIALELFEEELNNNEE